MSTHDVPYMLRWPKDFWTSSSVAKLAQADPPAHLEYSALLDLMWMNGGKIVDDDAVIARLMMVSIEHWLSVRGAIMNICRSVSDEDGVLHITQRRLQRDWDEANQARDKKRGEAAHARSVRSAKVAKRKANSAADKRKPQEPELAPDIGDSDKGKPIQAAMADVASALEQATRTSADAPIQSNTKHSKEQEELYPEKEVPSLEVAGARKEKSEQDQSVAQTKAMSLAEISRMGRKV